MENQLNKIELRSKENPRCEFKWLMPLISVENLRSCFQELDGNKALGVDGQSKEEYGRNLDENLRRLVARMKTMSYIPKPVKEVLIPKASGGMRPLGIVSFEDKIVQRAFAKILEAIYEPTFVENSYGFRPKRNCHQAVKAITDFAYTQKTATIVEIDFKNFFGSIDRSKLLDMLRIRIKDETFIRYIVRMLRSGILREDSVEYHENGMVQGSGCSPMLANIYAHYALDEWFDRDVKPRIRGVAKLVRFCDDGVFLFSNERDAEAFEKELPLRVSKFGLELHPEKTKLIKWNKVKREKGRGQETFCFLGFQFYLGLNMRRTFALTKVKSDPKRMSKKLKEVGIWLREHRHLMTIRDLWDRFCSKMRGYANYYCISYNSSRVASFICFSTRLFFKWVNRRSQKKSMSWAKFQLFMAKHDWLPDVHVRFELFPSRRNKVIVSPVP